MWETVRVFRMILTFVFFNERNDYLEEFGVLRKEHSCRGPPTLILREAKLLNLKVFRDLKDSSESELLVMSEILLESFKGLFREGLTIGVF